MFKTPKGTSFDVPFWGTASFDVFCVKVSVGSRLWARGRTQKTNILGVIVHPHGEKNPLSDLHKILQWRDIQDVIIDANFGVDRLRGFNVARGQILGFSIGFRSRPYCPYNTLALPWEWMISIRWLVCLAANKITQKVVDEWWSNFCKG